MNLIQNISKMSPEVINFKASIFDSVIWIYWIAFLLITFGIVATLKSKNQSWGKFGWVFLFIILLSGTLAWWIVNAPEQFISFVDKWIFFWN